MENRQSFSEYIFSLGGFAVPNAEYAAVDFEKHKNENIDKWLIDIIKNSSILYNKEVLNYLYSLYNLEISALNKSNNPRAIQEALYNFDFYKKLVSYNILNRSYKLIEELKNGKSLFKKEDESIRIYLKDKVESDRLLFWLDTNYEMTTINFYDDDELSLDIDRIKEKNNRRVNEINIKLSELKEQIREEEEKEKIELARIEEFRRQKATEKMYALSEEDEDACDDIYGPSDEELGFSKGKFSPKKEEKRLKDELANLIKLDDKYYNRLYNISKDYTDLSREIKTILFKDFGISDDDFKFEGNTLVKKFKTTTIRI